MSGEEDVVGITVDPDYVEVKVVEIRDSRVWLKPSLHANGHKVWEYYRPFAVETGETLSIPAGPLRISEV